MCRNFFPEISPLDPPLLFLCNVNCSSHQELNYHFLQYHMNWPIRWSNLTACPYYRTIIIYQWRMYYTDIYRISRIVHGPDGPPPPPVHPPQEHMRPISFCSWDLYEHDNVNCSSHQELNYHFLQYHMNWPIRWSNLTACPYYRTIIIYQWRMYYTDIYRISRIVHGPDGPPPPPFIPHRNIWDLFHFVPGTYTNMTSECHHYQIGMDYLWGAIFNTLSWNMMLPDTQTPWLRNIISATQHIEKLWQVEIHDMMRGTSGYNSLFYALCPPHNLRRILFN